MERTLSDNVQKCREFLTAAKSDNEKFAALLMVPKVIKSEELSALEREDLLKSIGIGFLIRLLKSKSVPEGCSEHVYRSVALSIISGLVRDTTMVHSTDVYKVLPQINDVIQSYHSAPPGECQVIMDDTYDLLRVFTESLEGIELLISSQCIKCLVNLIIAEGYGSDKAVDLCIASFICTNRRQWSGQGETIHGLLNVLCYNMSSKQDEQKFILCDTVAAVIRCLPEEHIEECPTQPWYKLLIRSLTDIFTSKISAAQREPTLKLAAVAVDCVGIKVVLPPSVQDCKLLLIITHRCCIEVRMILETNSHDKVVEKAEVLCSCYQILEHVIGHMTSAPSLLLDDKQILQLHRAMLGAFNAVVGFLNESAETFPMGASSAKMPEPVVIATVRVLGAWLAEETSALKKEIYQILPYLIQICKIQILLSQISTHTSERNKERKVQFDISEELDSCSLDSKCENLPSENLCDSTHSCTSETESRNVHSSVENNDINKKLHEATDHNTDMKNSHQGKEVADRLTNSESNNHDGTNSVSSSHGDTNSVSSSHGNTNSVSSSHGNTNSVSSSHGNTNSVPSSHGNTNSVPSSHGNTNSVPSSHGNTNSVSSSHGNTNSVPSNGLQTNSVSSNVDVIRLLLPGLCHLSAEDEPRKILLENQTHELLNKYFKSAVSLVLEAPHNTITKSSVELLCGIFLNITVQEPILVSQDSSFHNITGILMEACPVIGKSASCLTVWANMVTLGMFLLRNQSHVKWTDGDVLLQFFVSTCQFIKRAYVRSPTVTQELSLSESYSSVWEDIGQLWFLCVQTTTECVKLYPSLIQAVLSTGLLPHISKVLLSVDSKKCQGDVSQSLMSLLTASAVNDQKARDVLKTTSGDQLARLYKCAELQNLLV